MKANHNCWPSSSFTLFVVVNISKSKNESKSQLAGAKTFTGIVVVNISKSKNESKSQRGMLIPG